MWQRISFCGGVRKGKETSQKQPQHTGGVSAWWCSSFGTSDSRAHSCLCQCSPALFTEAGLWSWGHPIICTTLHSKARHQPSKVCFPGRICGMLSWARPIFAAAGFVAHSTTVFLPEVPQAQRHWWISYRLASVREVAEWSSTHVLYRAKRMCQFLQKQLLAEFLPL